MKLVPAGMFVAVVSSVVAIAALFSGDFVSSLGISTQQPSNQSENPSCPPSHGCPPSLPSANLSATVPFYVFLNGSKVSPTYSVSRGENLVIVADVESNKSLYVSVTTYPSGVLPVSQFSSRLNVSFNGISVAVPTNSVVLKVGSNVMTVAVHVGPAAGDGIHSWVIAVEHSNGIGSSGFLAGFNLKVQG